MFNKEKEKNSLTLTIGVLLGAILLATVLGLLAGVTTYQILVFFIEDPLKNFYEIIILTILDVSVIVIVLLIFTGLKNK